MFDIDRLLLCLLNKIILSPILMLVNFTHANVYYTLIILIFNLTSGSSIEN